MCKPTNIQFVKLPRLLSLCALMLLSACKKDAPPVATPGTISGPIPQSAYVWQRDWTSAVSRSITAHSQSFETLALLAGQVEWNDTSPTPKIVRPAIDWPALSQAGKPIGLVIRVQRPGNEASTVETITKLFTDRLTEASNASGAVAELQIDYDCPQKKLEGYTAWFIKIKSSLASHSLPLKITALPTWLGEQNFTSLADATDGYILQVHSFDVTTVGKSPTVCDPAMALAWVAQAAKLERPFYVALPTYRCLAGYAPDGKYLGMAADAGSPSWPPGTNILDLESDPAAIAGLVSRWTTSRPSTMQGLYWYRLPVDGEMRNWRWATFNAVMSGRSPVSKLEIRASAGNPVDFKLHNLGETDELLPREINVRWTGPELVVADASPGWTCQKGADHINFIRSTQATRFRLAPDQTTPIGWIRHHETSATATAVPFSFEIIR